MEMIAMRLRQVAHHDRARFVGRARMGGQSRQLLQQGERPELQRIEIERVLFRRHGGI
jgi:hypothetical protein